MVLRSFICYRALYVYSRFFGAGLLQELSLQKFEKFKYLSSKVVNIHVPVKEKHVRSNEFMNEELGKAVMTRARLLNIRKKIYCQKNIDQLVFFPMYSKRWYANQYYQR